MDGNQHIVDWLVGSMNGRLIDCWNTIFVCLINSLRGGLFYRPNSRLVASDWLDRGIEWTILAKWRESSCNSSWRVNGACVKSFTQSLVNLNFFWRNGIDISHGCFDCKKLPHLLPLYFTFLTSFKIYVWSFSNNPDGQIHWQWGIDYWFIYSVTLPNNIRKSHFRSIYWVIVHIWFHRGLHCYSETCL